MGFPRNRMTHEQMMVNSVAARQRMKTGTNPAVVAAKQRHESNGLGMGGKKINRSGNSRDGQVYKTTESGGSDVHTYTDGTRVVLKHSGDGTPDPSRPAANSGQETAKQGPVDNSGQAALVKSLSKAMDLGRANTAKEYQKKMPLMGRH